MVDTVESPTDETARTGPLGRPAAPTPVDALRWTVAGALFGAAALHFAVAPDHFAVGTVHGAFFVVAAWVQLILAVAVLRRPAGWVLRSVVVVDVGAAALWAMSRITGLPVEPGAWVPEPVGFADLVATACEVLAVAGAVALLDGRLRARLGHRALGRRLLGVAGAVAGVALVALTTAAVAPALGGGHSHAAHAAGHDHSGDVAGATTADAGAADGHTHPTVPGGATVGIESGTGTSPCELSGATVNGGEAHGHRGPSVQAALDEPTRSLLAVQLTQARAAAARYPTAADATAAGYRRVTGYLPCIGAHYMNFSLVDGTFDPEQPEMLLYGGNGPTARMIGLSYYVTGTAVAPDGFAGPNDPWHQHIGLCTRGGVVVGGSSLTAEECAQRGGTKADGSTSWMVHAWVVPGWESAWGTFSAEHPELGRTAPS